MPLDRRRLFGLAGLMGLGGLARAAGAQPAPASGERAGAPGTPPMVQSDGGYAGVPLARSQVRASAIQSALMNVSVASREADLRRNLAHVLDQIDAVFNYYGEKDLVAIHSQALHGWDKWTKAELERIALRIPGPQSEAICQRARQYGCWIAFGGYMVDPDWPGHVIDAMVLASPEGRIVSTQWKATTQRSQRPGADYFVTHVVDVLDAYVERYGLDAVLPVARTPIGNIALSSVFREPELFRALAMKGAEIFVRSGLGGYTQADGELVARTNRVFTLYLSNALSPGNPRYFPDNGYLGNTAIYGLRGEVMARADKHETAVNATLDVGARRAQGLIPDISWDLYAPVYGQYRSRFAPNAYAERVPADLADASRLVAARRRWRG